MLTNSSVNKLKASKSSRELVNFVNESEGTHKIKLFEKTGEGDRDNDDGCTISRNSLSSKAILSRERADSRLKPRIHLRDEFHMAQGSSMDRRSSNIRGRGGGFSRKMERENDSNSSSRGRFQESLSSKANFSDVSTYTSKYSNDAESKSRMDHAFNILPEDSRISKTIRRLSREEDSEKFLALCQQLQDSLMAADNTRYIRRAFDDIASSLRGILHRGPGSEAKNQISKCLGRVGFVLIEQDFKRYAEWIFSQYTAERATDVKMLLLKAMIETLRLDSENPKLKDFSSMLTSHLQTALENTDLPELTMATVDVIISVTESYPSAFTKYFRDTVDILVGWHIDGSHSENITYYASCSLLRLGQYWVADLSFSVTLLGQFLEDMEAEEEELHQLDSTVQSLDRINGLIKVFNTVARCLGQHLNPATSHAVSWSFLTDNLAKMLRATVKALRISLHEGLVVTANECVCLLLSLLQSRVSSAHDRLYEMMDIQLAAHARLEDSTVVSVLATVAKVVREVSGNLPMELVRTLLRPESPVLRLRFSPSLAVQTEVLGVYHALLNLKNIPLLQEAYRNVLGDLERAYRTVLPSVGDLVPAPNPHALTRYSAHKAELVVLFHLRALTVLANATNSIIGMWALNPSILELLAVLLRPHEVGLGPAVQHAVLRLLHSHCSKSNNFVSTSEMVSTVCNTFGLPANLGPDAQGVSPTGRHFSVILRLLARLLGSPAPEETLVLALAWSREVVCHSEPYLTSVCGGEDFAALLALVAASGRSGSPAVVCAAADCLGRLLAVREADWGRALLGSVAELCLLHANSTRAPVRGRTSRLLPLLPWDVVVAHAAAPAALAAPTRAHVARGAGGEMRELQFKRFMAYLLQGADHGGGGWLSEMFCQCWPPPSPRFCRLALESNAVLLPWATWAAAQLCVAGKLRTPLGKALDTFTSIEGAVKSLAREPTQKAVTHSNTFEQRRVRLLLEFLEHLEKSIHNAAEGCASAMPPPPKPIRAFFHTNRSVCGEWLKRIRMAVMVVAIRAGLATTAVRHGHCLLQGLADAGSTQGADFEQAAMYVCWALCKLREPEAIQGLYAWCREVSGRRFYWLKASCQQASGKYETAAEEYRKLLEQSSPRHSPAHAAPALDENAAPPPPPRAPKGDPDPQVLGFMADQLAECYTSVQNWSDLHRWKLREVELWANKNGGTPLKYLLNSVSADHVKAMKEFEEGDYIAASELMKWPTNERPVEQLMEATRSWSSYKAMSLVNSTLTTIALQLAAGSALDTDQAAHWSQMLENCLVMSQCYLQEGLRNPPSEFLHDAIVLQYAAAGLQGVVGGEGGRNAFSVTDVRDLGTSLLTRALWWARCLDRLTGAPAGHAGLCLEAVRAARKEGNPAVARRLLLGHLGRGSLEELAAGLPGDDPPTPGRVRALTEAAKLLYSTDRPEKAVELCALTATALSTHLVDGEARERSSRLLLTLSKWLGGEDAAVLRLIGEEKTRNNFATFSVDDGPISVPASDVAIGYLLQLAAARCPTLSKTWEQYATWCYRWGRRMVETDLATSQLSDVDKAAVQQLMPRGTTIKEFERVTTILSQTRSVAREEDIEGEDINTSEMIKSQLQNVRTLATASRQQLDALVGIWRNTQQRIYSYLQQAATAYFKYLELCGDTGADDCKTIIATLRLLRLIVKHALELQDVLESGLGSTPVGPWKVIIPQLFSRLSHPEPYVRTRVSELLCRVAQDAPHLITFPAVVGAVAGGARLRDITRVSTSRLFSAGLSQPEDEEEEEEEEDDDDEGSSEEVSVLQNCFLAMVDTLSKQAPVAISQVQLVVSELHRITLLWDELWLGTLVQHHAEISRRLSQLEAEINRVDDNPSLTLSEKDSLVAEKHRIILKPLVFILEQLHAITSVPPETPHETWFQEKFNGYIAEALQKLKCPTNPRKPQDSWHPLKLLQSRLQQRASKRSAYAIDMRDVSPALAALKDTVIAMPGVTPSPGKIITIAAVDNHITILPTKTKPKKLVFHGNDGRMYTYLFKGLEDLHLDERIMQFLSIANTMMSSERGGHTGTYRARHYSVIPLGPRSGLISWVDGVTPLFGLYKRWQQREAAAGSLKGQTNASGGGTAQVMRPSEMFYSKLTPLLKEKGITNLENRKEWPSAILRQVLTELMDETPKDLLAKELWGHSVNAGGWWRSTRTYSYSVAVMSVIGYIIGLGDRHLDNVLVDLATGEVVHIDYNVCFEKGKTLRVPEKVPFRMTPNIRTALGVTGVEGIFRLTCEHVLKVMKKGRETLLTLLEAFVYDPLIDWTPGNEAGYTGAVYGRGQAVATETKQSRKELEREVTRAMFCVRITEIKAEWLHNRDDVMEAIPELVAQLNKWLQVQNSIKTAEEALQDCHQQIALVKEAEAQGPVSNHPLYTLSARYAKHRRAKDALAKVRTALADKVEECDRHLSLHKAAVANIRGPQLALWMTELNYPVDKDSHLVFDLVKEFLRNAGQVQTVAQCEQSESEIRQLAQQQDILIRNCLHLLSQYADVSGLYPASYLNTHRAVCFRRWAAHLLTNMSLESMSEVRGHLTALLSPHPAAGQQVFSASYQLQAALGEANVRINKCFERLAIEGLPDNALMLDAAFVKARGAMSAFPHSEKGAALALECVLVTALCALNRKYLMMEAAAFCAGDCLVDLTSRDGDWFLDEMYNISNLVTELSAMIPTHSVHGGSTDTRVQLVLQCVQSSHIIYKGLQELNFNFHTIILPEAVKTIQTEEPSVLATVRELGQTIAGVGCPLGDLLGRLEKHLRCIIMEMDSPHADALHLVSVLRTRFETLLHRTPAPTPDGDRDPPPPDDGLSPGQMLLMGFNGLFEKLQLDGNALVSALDTLDTPGCWKKVDQVWDAKAMAAPVFNDATRGVLEDIFLIKRLQTMQEFFSLCEQMARTSTVVHDDDRLNKPIRRFIADYVSRRLLGVLSQTLALALCLLLQRIGLNVTVEVEQRDVGAESKVSLEELCRKAVDMCMKRGRFGGGVLAQASGLTSTLETAWRRRELAKHLQQDLEAKRSTLQRLQQQLTAFHWLHEDSLQGAVAMTPMALLSRANFMMELRKTSSALITMQPRLLDARDQQSALVGIAENRLKWAAGANPALMDVLAAFESTIAARNERLTSEQRMAADIGNTCNALLQHEALRTRTSEATIHDNAFVQLLEQCEQCCLLATGYDQTITLTEESLVQLLAPEGSIDNTWIHNAEVLISDNVKSLQQQIVALQESLVAARCGIKGQAGAVRNLMDAHNKLMADVKNLVKSMVKYEDNDLAGLQDYWNSYRAYSEQFATLTLELATEDLDLERIHVALDQLSHLREKTTAIYEDLLVFAVHHQVVQPGNGTDGAKPRRPPLLRQESVCLSPRRGVPTAQTEAKKGGRDPHTGKELQERNAYAVGVWRRVRTKLEGRDPDLGRKATVQEQVDYVIREATSLDNLALLYEGWTPWV